MRDFSRQQSKTKKYIFISLSAIAVVVLLIWGYSIIKWLKDPVVPAINAIPANTVCLLKINSPQGFWQHINSQNMIWKELQCLKLFSGLDQKFRIADSVTASDKTIKDNLLKNPLYIAWIPWRGGYLPLYAINLPGAHFENMIDNFIRKNISTASSLSYTEFIESRIYIISTPKKPSFCYTVYKGIFIAAENTGLIENSLSALITGICINNSRTFSKVSSMAGKNVDANIYITMSYIDNLFQPLFIKSTFNDLKYVSLTSEIASMDLVVKNNELLLNGYAISMDSIQLFEKVFKKQDPQKISLTSICPDNTALLYYWGLSDVGQFVKDYSDFKKTNFHKSSYHEMCSYYDSVFSTDIEKNFFDELCDEIGYIVTENPNTSNPYRSYAIFKTKDVNSFLEHVADISASLETKTKEIKDTFAIKKFIPGKFFSNFFGQLFSPIDSAYYIIINDFVIFGNSPTSLMLFVSGYSSGKTLNRNENYKNFSDNVSEKASFCFYANIRKSFNLLHSLFSGKNEIDKNRSRLKNFQAIAFQFATENNKFYLNGYIKHNAFYIEENPSVWEFQADTTIIGKAKIFTDPNDSSKKIVFADLSGKIYLLSSTGELIWKKQTEEIPISDFYIITPKNRKSSYLVFNSLNFIYFLGLKEKKEKINKIRLPFMATAGLIVLDYDKNRNYRLIIPCLNQKIYNFSVDGQHTPGWYNMKTLTTLAKPVEYIKFGKKEFLIATDKSGRIYFMDRRGHEMFKKKKPFLKAENSSFNIYSDGKKQYLMTTDKRGQLIFIASNGLVEVVKMNSFTKDHYFIYGDYNNDGKHDFIYFDLGKIYVFNHKKKKIFESFTKSEPGAKPIYLRINNKKYYIIYPDESHTKLAIMNNLGFMETDTYTIGNKEIEINWLHDKKIRSIIASDSSKLFNYIIE